MYVSLSLKNSYGLLSVFFCLLSNDCPLTSSVFRYIPRGTLPQHSAHLSPFLSLSLSHTYIDSRRRSLFTTTDLSLQPIWHVCPPFPPFPLSPLQLYRKRIVTWEHVPFVALYALAAYMWVTTAGNPYAVSSRLMLEPRDEMLGGLWEGETFCPSREHARRQ
jgi:hypothetical protein